jgi:hypothetical protein
MFTYLCWLTRYGVRQAMAPSVQAREVGPARDHSHLSSFVSFPTSEHQARCRTVACLL